MRARVLKVRELEALGAEVTVYRADVADRDEMAAVVAETRRRHGRLHGVVHAAGVTGDELFLPIADLKPCHCEEHFRAKVQGVRVLDEVLADEPLDFCLLTSSLSPILGGLSFYAYSAANQYMDAFARWKRHTTGRSWISVNWADWLAEDETVPETASTVAALAITGTEGIDTFERILTTRHLAEVVVSSGDLNARLRQWVTPGKAQTVATPPQAHRRPNLRTAYVAPTNELEEALAEIWSNLFAIGQVGVHDRFLDLGGNSLLGIQVLAGIRERFQVELPLTALFDAPTVAELAALVEEALFRELEGMSDEEARRRVSDDGPEGTTGETTR
jgi:acyl carrier protein